MALPGMMPICPALALVLMISCTSGSRLRTPPFVSPKVFPPSTYFLKKIQESTEQTHSAGGPNTGSLRIRSSCDECSPSSPRWHHGHFPSSPPEREKKGPTWHDAPARTTQSWSADSPKHRLGRIPCPWGTADLDERTSFCFILYHSISFLRLPTLLRLNPEIC